MDTATTTLNAKGYEAVIGLEIHVELLTNTKLFCGCANTFGSPPNSQVCPVCLGLPGSLPVVNKRAIEFLLRTALALECTIPPQSKFDRKNYFYPDMPKNYQISQYDRPLAQHGKLWIGSELNRRCIGITRIHLEEDTGKSLHVGDENADGTVVTGGRIGDAAYTLLDYNRAGVPLIEIVTEPDIRLPEEAREFLNHLKQILEYLEISNCKMEEGSLRCDANVSIRPTGSTEFGVKTEIKNMNSFRSVERAIAYEIQRQIEMLNQNQRVVQETRAWDEKNETTFSMRSKEEAHDYRYFPEPDLPLLEISKEWLKEIKETIPELPHIRQARFINEYTLPVEDAEVLCADKNMADYFEKTVRIYIESIESTRHYLLGEPNEENIKRAHELMAVTVANWLNGEVRKNLNDLKLPITQILVPSGNLAGLLIQIDKGVINAKIAKDVLAEMFATGKKPEEIIKEKGLEQIADEGALRKIVASVIEDPVCAKSLEEYSAGKEKALGFVVGQVMKKSGGKANPALVNQILKQLLEQPKSKT